MNKSALITYYWFILNLKTYTEAHREVTEVTELRSQVSVDLCGFSVDLCVTKIYSD